MTKSKKRPGFGNTYSWRKAETEARQQKGYFGRAGFGNYRELPGTRYGVVVAA